LKTDVVIRITQCGGRNVEGTGDKGTYAGGCSGAALRRVEL
jgi:hypothetical protein